MTPREQVLQQALQLPPADRACVVAALQQSLAAEQRTPPAGAAFLAELQRRSASYRSGATDSRLAADVLAD